MRFRRRGSKHLRSPSATRETAIQELREAKAGGIGTIIDLTTPDLGRDVELVRDVAQASGMNIIVATGIWRDVPRSGSPTRASEPA